MRVLVCVPSLADAFGGPVQKARSLAREIRSLGHEVVDSFYVVDQHGTKLDDERIGELKRSVLFELSRLAG